MQVARVFSSALDSSIKKVFFIGGLFKLPCKRRWLLVPMLSVLNQCYSKEAAISHFKVERFKAGYVFDFALDVSSND